MLEELSAFTLAISKQATQYLLAFAAVGALTMAIIQTIKELTPARAWFHRREMKRWLAAGEETRTQISGAAGGKRARRTGGAADAGVDRLMLSNPFSGEASETSGAELCRRQLIMLATAGNAAALYALEIEKLAGQLNAAAALVADNPRKYPDLLRCLARHADKSDVEHLVENDPPEPDAKSDKQHREAVNRYLDRKVRVTHHIQRNIDGFQIATHYRWSWVLQLCSFGLSFVIAMVAVAYSVGRNVLDPATFWSSLPLALVAGFLAPIARDLVAIIRKP
jgi:hypothetical protein